MIDPFAEALTGGHPNSLGRTEEVVAVVREHFRLLRAHFSESDRAAILRMRKFGAWYAHGFRGAVELRRRFQRVSTEEDLEAVLGDWLRVAAT